MGRGKEGRKGQGDNHTFILCRVESNETDSIQNIQLVYKNPLFLVSSSFFFLFAFSLFFAATPSITLFISLRTNPTNQLSTYPHIKTTSTTHSPIYSYFSHLSLHSTMTSVETSCLAPTHALLSPPVTPVMSKVEEQIVRSCSSSSDHSPTAEDPVPVPKDLDDLVRLLHIELGVNGLDSKEVDVARVQKLMASYTSNQADWQKYAMFDKGRYTRNLVDDGNGKFNLMILAWPETIGRYVKTYQLAHIYAHSHPNTMQPQGTKNKKKSLRVCCTHVFGLSNRTSCLVAPCVCAAAASILGSPIDSCIN